MNKSLLRRKTENMWVIDRTDSMNVDGVIFASEKLLQQMEEKVLRQICNVASLPGVVEASYAMPDAHWGYGFCIGGVAAFDADKGGVVSAGGVGFDIACGVRTLRTGLKAEAIEPVKEKIADMLFAHIPAGVGSTGTLKLNISRLDDVLTGGAGWAVEHCWGTAEDLRFIESGGCVAGAKPSEVSQHAKKRQLEQMGTLGSGNHYLEIQKVVEIYDADAAKDFGIAKDDITVSIHCGSRGLGHQIGTDFLKLMAESARADGIQLAERELACALLNSKVGQSYLGAMRCGINCALANRQILAHLVREVFDQLFPRAHLTLIYDVSHNTCQEEEHFVNGKKKRLFVHRKGATRAFGPSNPALPAEYRRCGQPVLIGGTMGTASYIMAGTAESEHLAFSSACHGAGRSISRTAATKQWQGRDIARKLGQDGILIRTKSMRGIAEEAPEAYKDVSEVVRVTDNAGLAKKVARLVPLVCVKG